MQIYSVKRGDNILSISQMFNVSIQSIVDANSLTQPVRLLSGMELVIPTISTISYTIKPGDTLSSIAHKFNVDYMKILALNNINHPLPLFVGQKLNIPIQKQKPVIETLAYYDPSSAKNKTYIINMLGKYITYLGIFNFPITSSGEIVGELDLNIIAAARIKNISILPVLTNLSNGEFNSELAETVLSSTSSLNNLLNNILVFLKKYNLQGINIDFENLYPKDRDLYTKFIRLLSQSLHKNNKILIVNIAPKWEDSPEKDWVGFFDYNAIGPYIDIAAIMTYEWGWREGPPRPTAPVKYIKQSLDYAIANNIPQNKILMGMTLYGYNWELPHTTGKIATAITLPEVWNLSKTYNAEINFDNDAKQSYMDYISSDKKHHRIWFEDALSHYLKYQIVKGYGLRGVFYWVLPQTLSSTWYILSDMFTIKKYIR